MPSCLASSAGAALRLLGAQLGVAGRLQHGVERLLVLAGVVVRAGRRGERELVGRDEVHAADLGRVHADLVGGDVDHALDELRRLRPPGAAVGTDGRVVRQDAGGLEPHVGDLVHADRHHLGERRQDRAETRVRAGRGHDRTVEADDLAVARSRRAWPSSRSRGRARATPCPRSGSRSTSPAARASTRPPRSRGARRTGRPWGRSRHRPTGTRRAAGPVRARASGRTRRAARAAPDGRPNT